MSATGTSSKQSWVVGVDGSPDSVSALGWAVRMATGREEVVTPVSAWHVPLALAAMAGRRGGDVDEMGLRAQAGVAAADTLAAVEQTSTVEGVVAASIVEEGHPTQSLLDRSSPESVIVVGRRGVSAVKHRLLGSVSQYLATHAVGPVVVVPADWDDRPCQKVIVGFDGSAHSVAALRWAIDIVPDTAAVIALMALDVSPWLDSQGAVDLYPEVVAGVERQMLDALDAADPTGRTGRLVATGGPRDAFEASMADADLVVVGPRGMGGLERTMLGSVSTWLLSNAPCPVAVIPTGDVVSG